MTLSIDLLNQPLPLVLRVPSAVETHLYRYIARDEHAASFVCRVMPASEKPSTTFTLRFDGLDRESLDDYFTSEEDMIEGLSYVDVYDVIERAVRGDANLCGFVEMTSGAIDHDNQPIHELVNFPVDRALSSIVLASRDDGDATCDVLDWVTYEDTLPSGTAIQTIPGNLEVWFHRGATIHVEKVEAEACASAGETRYNMTITFGMSVHVRDPECFVVHSRLLG